MLYSSFWHSRSYYCLLHIWNSSRFHVIRQGDSNTSPCLKPAEIQIRDFSEFLYGNIASAFRFWNKLVKNWKSYLSLQQRSSENTLCNHLFFPPANAIGSRDETAIGVWIGDFPCPSLLNLEPIKPGNRHPHVQGCSAFLCKQEEGGF